MATLSITVGSTTSTLTPAKTNAQVAEILGYFIADWAGTPPNGLTTTQLNQWKLDQATRRIADMISQEARRVRLRELRMGQSNIEDQATTDTSL